MVVRFYHYTNEESLAGIRYYETILPSMTGKFGCGVYFSRLGPRDLPLDKLAVNCFGAGGQARLRKGHLNCYIEVIVRNHRKVFEKCRAGGRDVFIYRGQMVLRHFAWRAGFVAGPIATIPMRRPALQPVVYPSSQLRSREYNFSQIYATGSQCGTSSSPFTITSQSNNFSQPFAPLTPPYDPGYSPSVNFSPSFAPGSQSANFPPLYDPGYSQSGYFSPLNAPGSQRGFPPLHYDTGYSQNGNCFPPSAPRSQDGNYSPPCARGSQDGNFPPPCTPRSQGGNFPPLYATGLEGGNPPPPYTPGSQDRNFPPTYVPRSQGGTFPPPYTPASQDGNFLFPYAPVSHDSNFPPPYTPRSEDGSFPPPYAPGSQGGNFSPPYTPVSCGKFSHPYAPAQGHDLDFSSTYVGEPLYDHFSSSTFRGQSHYDFTNSPANVVVPEGYSIPPPVCVQQVKPTSSSSKCHSASARNPPWDSYNSSPGSELQSDDSLSETGLENKENRRYFRRLGGKKRKVLRDGTNCVSAKRKRMNNTSRGLVDNHKVKVWNVKSEVNDSGYLSYMNSSQVSESPVMKVKEDNGTTSNINNNGNISQVINQTVEILQKLCNWVGW